MNEHEGNPRRFKRFLRRHGALDPVYEAFSMGGAAASYPRDIPPRWRRNPYPPGVRHDEYDRGYASADPLGDHHGRNE